MLESAEKIRIKRIHDILCPICSGRCYECGMCEPHGCEFEEQYEIYENISIFFQVLCEELSIDFDDFIKIIDKKLNNIILNEKEKLVLQKIRLNYNNGEYITKNQFNKIFG